MKNQVIFMLICIIITVQPGICSNSENIRPWKENPRYWQYKGKPVLLIGGSKDDNLFQVEGLREHLDLMVSVGANVIRNTMSDRPDKKEVYAYKQVDGGKYDLDQWNPEYWKRFENLLKWTYQRDIIVQIEVWDRFDYTDAKTVKYWQLHPYNPKNNINYTYEQSGFAEWYKLHPAADRQPFFHTIPGLKQYKPKYDLIRRYQERFVSKMLSYSLKYPNVLYCMNNETSSSEKWGLYWMKFIKDKAKEAGVIVNVTDMFDNGFIPESSPQIKFEIDHPELYDFIDISQVNSRNFNETHWEKLVWYNKHIAKNPRPLNHTKIYSDGQSSWGSGTPVDGVERFWRNLIAGSASSRFHRPTAGIGLNEIAQNCIKAARLIEKKVRFWDVKMDMQLLSDRSDDEAYLAADEGRKYILFMTDGGEIGLDMKRHPGQYEMSWVDISKGLPGPQQIIKGDNIVRIKAPGSGPWSAAITVR